MPRTKFDKPKYPPIDWVMAAILERKKTMKLEWADIANEVGMSPEGLRKLVAYKRSDQWPTYTLKKVCKALGIEYKSYLVGSPEGEE